MTTNQVAVIILNYKSWQETLIEAKEVHDMYFLNWPQIIIVDNASPNESEQKLKEKVLGDYVFIESGSNKGYAAGNNIGLKYANDNGFKYCWILNNDIIIDDPDLVKTMLSIFEKDSSVAVVNPDIYSPEGHLFNRDSHRFSFYDMTIGIRQYIKKGRDIEDLGGYGYIYRPQGCCMMVDLQKMNDVDYMDEHTFLYCEEYILAERLLKKGWRCACALTTKVIHNHSKTVKSSLGKWKVMRAQNKSYNYYLKEYRGFSLLERSICTLFYSVKNYITN